MKTITIEAEDSLIEAAQQAAAAEHISLNTKIRKWLEDYARKWGQANTAEAKAQRQARIANWDDISKTIDIGGRKFTREEMNARSGAAPRRMTRGELAVATLKELREKHPTHGRKFTRDEMNER